MQPLLVNTPLMSEKDSSTCLPISSKSLSMSSKTSALRSFGTILSIWTSSSSLAGKANSKNWVGALEARSVTIFRENSSGVAAVGLVYFCLRDFPSTLKAVSWGLSGALVNFTLPLLTIYSTRQKHEEEEQYAQRGTRLFLDCNVSAHKVTQSGNLLHQIASGRHSTMLWHLLRIRFVTYQRESRGKVGYHTSVPYKYFVYCADKKSVESNNDNDMFSTLPVKMMEHDLMS